jgi:chlorophyllide a reductase subunit Z
VESQPVLIRISGAKQLREAAESGARQAGERCVSAERVEKASGRMGQPA